MADDRSIPKGVVAQAHAVGHASAPPSPSSDSQQQNSPVRGPRTLLVRRSENGFGFTLRHFIVYPPESCCMLPGHERTRIDEPMDTIFVKQVRLNSPAAEAGLRTGDRVVSVDGAPTRGEQYASVVQRIQQAGPWLRLLVVSKEDDILQRYFGETAHNPETNQRPPRLRSPERLLQKQRRSSSMIPGPSSRARQSWMWCSSSGTVTPPSATLSPRRPPETDNQGTLYEHPERPRRRQKDTVNSTSQLDLYDRTRPESIYSRPSSTERIYDRIKDPIYERVVRPDSLGSKPVDHHYPISHAEPQVPIYRPGRRIVGRRASEGSEMTSETEIPVYGSVDALKTIDDVVRVDPGSRLSVVDSRRDSSPASKESLSSHDSNSTLTGNECSDDSVIMTRLRKSFEQKEEFLRRPSHPIGWLTFGESSGSAQGHGVIQREFYARPQKLQRQVWPPTEQQRMLLLPPASPPSSSSRLSSPTKQQSVDGATKPMKPMKPMKPTRPTRATRATKPTNQNVQRLKTDVVASEAERSNARSNERDQSPPSFEDVRAARDQFYSSLYDGNGRSFKESKYGPESGAHSRNNEDVRFRPVSAPSRSVNGTKATFVTTLSRIHENVMTAQQQQQQQQQQQGQDSRGGTSSLPSSPGPERKTGEKFAVPPQGLQIVSRRAKQFESGRLLNDDDDDDDDGGGGEQPTNDRTSLYKSELSRLSSKRSVPNVAVRKREFESKAEFQEPRRIPAHRESKSLDAETPAMETEPVRPRARSNSAESWEAANGSSRRSARHTWQTEQEDLDSKRNKAKRQDSYLQAVRTQLEREPRNLQRQDAISESEDVTKSDEPNAPLFPITILDVDADSAASGAAPKVTVSPPQPVRPNRLPIPNPPRASANRECSSLRHLAPPARPDVETLDGTAEIILAPGSDSSVNSVVLRRQKSTPVSDEDRTTRRVSYLKATWGERMHVDSDLELSDSEPPVHVLRSNSIVGGHVSTSGAGMTKDVEPIEQEGSLHVKFAVLDGKRSTDRSWKQVWGVLRGPYLFFYKDRHSQSPSTTSDGDAGQNVDVRCSLVDVAEDYTKRKHVLRVANPTAEVLLQTEDAASMALWLRALHKHAAVERPTDTTTGGSTTSKQQAVPQTPGPTTPSCAIQGGIGGSANQRLSPLPSHKGIRKLTSFRNRSPTGQSPVSKTRKPSQSVVEPLPSPKIKTWKGRVAKQLRRMHGQAGSPSSPTAQLPCEGATFKVPLELCPSASFSEFVPLIVEMCTSIVEARGLEVVGIYRVPGNTAAISQLTESVNRGFENISLQVGDASSPIYRKFGGSGSQRRDSNDASSRTTTTTTTTTVPAATSFQDPRWSDVNVISSLLKSFFRQLPDSLLTAELYPMFIDADKIEDPQRRMATIRKLLRDLPEHHFETLKYLMFHLKKVVEHSEVNKMEAKNLAIVFGPTLVRASGSRDNMVTMVTDMSHQCRIVESLLNNVDWFFSEDDLDDLSRLSVNLSLPADGNEVEPTSHTNHNLLLNNIQKVEGMREMVSARDIVSSIISAANRKIQRRRKGQDEVDNEEHDDDDKSKAKLETDNLAAVRQSMALNERQCSVSEIVLMHENKNQSSVVVPRVENDCDDGEDNGSLNVVSSTNRSKRYASTSQPIASETSGLSNDLESSSLDAISTISSSSNDTRQSNDEVAIRTYAGLSATTRERIRRFEQETKAMLQRDQHRQRREAEKREEERKRIEMEWQLAKREMENDDILDSMVDRTVTPTFLSERLANLNERLADRHVSRSRSTTRLTPAVSMAVQQQPTAQQRAQASSQLSSILGEKMSNGVIKKLKTDKETSLESVCLTPARYGSLDSLHEVHPSGPSPSQQQRGVPGDVSDDGSDLLTSLTSTFDRKWRSLVNPTNQQTPSTEREDNTKDRSQIRRGNPADVYRDPSLHKSPADKNCLLRTRNVAPEKDMDSTVTNRAVVRVTTPDNDRRVTTKSSTDSCLFLDATEKDENSRADVAGLPYTAKVKRFESLGRAAEKEGEDEDEDEEEEEEEEEEGEGEEEEEAEARCASRSEIGRQEETNSKEETRVLDRREVDSSYSNKLDKFENLSQASSESRSRLKRSESLNKKTENAASKLKRSESLNKHSDRLASPTNVKLKRSESLNKHSDNSESPNSKLKRSESLTKTEKTECNISKRRQSVRKESATKLKRKNGMPDRSIKRRHTVGGTKDFDKIHWLDNKLQTEAEKIVRSDNRPKRSQLRTSSPDLSSNRVNVADTSFLIEVSFRGPSNIVFNVTNARPQSLPDANLASKVFKVPLESHV